MKTYWATILSQQVGGLRRDMEEQFAQMDQRFEDLETRLSARIAAVDKKVDNLSDSVGEALHNFDTTTNDQPQNHETRITKLETTAA